MRILQFTPSIGASSGGTTSYFQLLTHSLGQIVELHIATIPVEDEVILENCTIHHINWSNWHLNKMKHQWIQLLNKIKPDVVHTNGCWLPQDAFTIIWSKEAGYPVVHTTHGMLDPTCIERNYWTRKLPALILYQKRALKIADCIITTSEIEKKHIEDLDFNPHVKVVPLGIEIDKIEFRSEWKTNKKILSLSRIHPIKGIENLIEATALCKRKLIGYEIIVAGNGDNHYINQLKQQVKDLGLETIIKFPGAIYGDSKFKLYQEADFFISSSLSENFGISIAESLAIGTPTITTKGTPWEDIVKHKCGYWVDANSKSLATAICNMIDLSDENRKEMGVRARNLIECEYSSKSMANRLVDIYQYYLSAKCKRPISTSCE